MTVTRVILATASLAISVGCYHAEITTGLTPSTEVVAKKFASSWIYGLVPPSTVETAAKCPTGVAKIETKLSFLNQLVRVVTFGIYTPMDIRVTCAVKASANAAGSRGFAVAKGADSETIGAAIDSAAARAAGAGVPMYLTFLP